VVDVARVAPLLARIEHGVVVENEEERVMTSFAVVVATVGLFMGDRFAGVLVDDLPFADGANGERAAPLDARTTDFIQRRLGQLGLRHDASQEKEDDACESTTSGRSP